MSSIVLYKGAKGMGKTLTMVKDALRYKSLGWTIYTNLEGTPFIKVTSDFILSLSGVSTLKNVVLVIDEIELFFDSRDWTNKESKNFGRFLQQIRKRHVPILCTCQYSDLIEKRLRQQIDIVVQCSYDRNTLICTNIYVDLTSFQSFDIPVCFTSIFYALPIFPLYNTYQIIS